MNSSPLINKPINSSMPAQQVSWKTKFETDKDKQNNTKWMKDSMDALEALGRYSFYNNIELRKNYEIMQGRFNVEDYIDSFEAYDMSSIIYQEMKLPSFLKHYDITTKAVKLLLGEFIKRPDILRVVAKDVQTSNEKLRIKSDLVWEFMKQSVNQEITNKLLQQGMDPNKSDFKNDEEESQYKEAIQQKYQELTPQSIEKYLTYDFRSSGEHWGQATLSDDLERFRIKEQDIVEFYDMCVSDRAFSHLYLTPQGYSMETWNPLTCFYQYNTQSKNIEDLSYAGRILYMSKTEIIDYFGWRMTQSQLEALYPEYQKDVRGGSVYKEAFNATLYPFANYREYDTLVTSVGAAVGETSLQGSPYGIPQFGFSPGVDGTNYMFTQSDIVQVTQAYWKSQRKIGKVNLQNPETGETVTQIVDETFDPKLFGVEEVTESYKDSDDPNTICWSWITEVWQGVKINVNYQKFQNTEERNAIYIDVRPTEFQFRGNDPRLIHTSKLPICGNIFNNRNGRSQAVVDLLKPYQILVNAFYNQAYHVAQKNNGKFFLMGASLLPNVKDWGGEESQEKFMTIVQNLGLGIVDDSTSAQAQSMQYGLKVLDMDESERITRLINLAMLIEQQGFMQLGITPQRQGSIQASETATATNAAVSNSYAITEIYFEQFNNYRRRKLQMLLELAQYVESEGEGDIVKQYTTSDLGQAFIKVNKTDLLLRDLGVYLMNSAEQQRKKELVEQLLLKNNQSLMPMSKLIETIRLDSLVDVQKKLEEQEKEQAKQAQAAEKAKNDAIMQVEQAKLEDKQKDRDNAVLIAQIKAQADLQKITLQGIANESSFDPNADLTDKLIAQKDIALKEQDQFSKNAIAQQQLTNSLIDSFNKKKLEETKMMNNKSLKDKEHKAKQGIEQSKLKQIETQNASQEKLSQDKHKNDLKLQQEKAKDDKELIAKQLELKNKDLEIKELDARIAKDKANLELKALQAKLKAERDLMEVKVDSIEQLTEAKVNQTKELAKVKIDTEKKSGEVSKKEIVQESKNNMIQNEQTHKQKLQQNEESHKMKLKQIKIKPKINKKK